MSSLPTRPAGSSAQHRLAPDQPLSLTPSFEDAIGGDAPPTDDTPTIISRNAPAKSQSPPPLDDAKSIRGRRLAHFELIEPIGVGGMAAVLRARDTQLDRFVALKILPPEMALEPENIRRFHQEARSAAKLDHENIARVFFCGEDQRLHFIAFEFVEGDNLRSIIEHEGRLPVHVAVHYMLQVAAGLAHAARRNVVHRDIKPSNIIITPNGRAKLVDLGLARSMEPRSGDNDLTQSGVTLGTFDYISPEQALEPRSADVRSDIYSLGCTFYHALTGVPPVPEGTAAKKLHHHQHVKPIDPREYVPDLPIEVVQILDRMMAKQPRERFQSPEQLVHQLLQVAQALGSSADVPEGVLSVETSLPNPRRSGHPLLWAALAAIAVVALVFFLDQGSGNHDPAKPDRPKQKEPVDPKNVEKGHAEVKENKKERPVVPTQPSEKDKKEVATYVADESSGVAGLMQWLEANKTASRIKLQLVGRLDFAAQEGPGILKLIGKQHVEISPLREGESVELRFGYPIEFSGTEFRAVDIESKTTTLKNIRFVLDGHKASTKKLTLVHLGPGNHQILGCEFVQARSSLLQNSERHASLIAHGQLRSEVTLRNCAFLGYQEKADAPGEWKLSDATKGGQVAIVRRGPMQITAEQCAFGPHTAAFCIEDNASEATVSVKGCSFLLPGDRLVASDETSDKDDIRSAVFDVSSAASARLVVSSSLIARHPTASDGAAVLIRQRDTRKDAVDYKGRDNRYFNLDGYWVLAEDWRKADWHDFRKLSLESRIVLSNPWAIDPLKSFETTLQESVAKAFALQVQLPSLRKTSGIVGAMTILGESWLVGELPPLAETEPTVAQTLVVVPNRPEDSSNGHYASLNSAITNARKDDTILLRSNEECKADPVQLNKRERYDLTIRPARQFRPSIEISEVVDAEVSLFHVHDGKLRLEGLEFRLKPAKPSGDVKPIQSIVTLAGYGECLFKNCLITMTRSEGAVLSVATLSEPRKVMAKADMLPFRSRDLGPKLSFEGCLIRGEGDVMSVKANRPFGMDVTDSFAALSGSMVAVEVAGEGVTPAPAQAMNLTFSQTTAYLDGNLVRVALTKDWQKLVPIKCKASKCLLLGATTGLTVLSLTAGEGEAKLLREKKKFIWDGSENAYGAFATLYNSEASERPVMMGTGMMEGWRTLTMAESSEFGVRLKSTPTGKGYPAMLPSDFGLPEGLTAGAPLLRWVRTR